MILTRPSFKILSVLDNADLGLIEVAGRTCYKSTRSTDKASQYKFIKNIIDKGHESVIEHSAMSVLFICDRGVSHELVRHRLCAFSQESTRYCNYKGGCEFIIPPWIDLPEGEYERGLKLTHPDYLWAKVMLTAEESYIELLAKGWSPQQARSVLPNSLKTEIVVTTNLREWRHIFKLRCAKVAHPQMRELMIPLFDEVKDFIPVIFDDIETY